MKRTFVVLTAILMMSGIAPAAFANEFKIGGIEISRLYARAMLPGAKVGGGYLKITNNGPADRLLAVASNRAASVQLHEMEMDGGIMVMRELKNGISVPANAVTDLRPGSYHIMFMNVAQPFKENETVKATLTFEKAGTVDVEFQVGPAAGGAPAMAKDPSDMGHQMESQQ